MKLKSSNITDSLPFLSYENGALVTKSGDISRLFKLKLPELYSLDKTGYETIHDLWCKAISTLPDFTVIHKQDYYFRNRYESKFSENQPPLDRFYELHFNEREYYNHESVLSISFCPKLRIEGKSNTSSLCSKNITPSYLSPESIERFSDSVENFISVFSGFSNLITIEPLSEDEIIGTKEKKGVLEKFLSLDFDQSEKTLMNDIQMSGKGVSVAGKKVNFYTISSSEMLPGIISDSRPVSRLSNENCNVYLSFPYPLGIGSKCNHIYNQYLFVGNSEKILKRLEASLRNMKALSEHSRSNRVNAVLLESFLDKARISGERVITAHFSVMTWSENDEEEKRSRTIIASAAGETGVQVHLDIDESPMLYWAAIPGNGGDFPSEESFYCFTPQAVAMFTEETIYRSSAATFGVKLSDRQSGRPLLVDLSDLPLKKGITSNRNKFVLGPSGTGKSFFMNHLLRSYYDQGANIVLIDIGNSYEGLSKMIKQNSGGKDGTYYTLDERKTLSFNPFALLYEADADEDDITNLSSLLIKLWKKDEEPLSRIEENMVGDFVDGYISKGDDVEKSFNGFYEYVLSKQAGETDTEIKSITENLLKTLRPYYKGGRYEYLLNNRTEEDIINDRFIVFEIDSIKDNQILMTVTSIIIMELFITKMKKLKGVRKMLVIEEAWRALATNRMASYIKYLYKTVRKYFGEAVIVTQEMDDVTSSSIVKESIIANSACKILMDQSRYMNRFDSLQSTLGLSDRQKAEILSINRSINPLRPRYNEVWIGLGSRYSKVYSLEVSPEEYFTYTTEEPEKKRVKEMTEKTKGDYMKAIEILADKYHEKECSYNDTNNRF